MRNSRQIRLVLALLPVGLVLGLACAKPGEEAAAVPPVGEPGAEASPADLAEEAVAALAAGPHAFSIAEIEGEEVVRRGRLLVAKAGGGGKRYSLTWEGEPPVRVSTDGETAFASGPGGEVLASSLARAGSILLSQKAGKLVPAALDPTSFTRYQVDPLPPVDGLRSLRAPIPGGGGWELSIGDDGLPRRVAFQAGAEAPASVLELEPIEVEVPAAAADYRLEPAPGGELIAFYAGPAPGDPAPDVSFELADGSTVALAELRGKAVVLDFWATWCMPCRPAMAELEELYRELGDEGLEVYGLRLYDQGDPASYLESLGITYPIGDGAPFEKPLAIDQYGLPALYVVGRDGRVVDLLVGFDPENSPATVRQAILEALG